MSINPHLHFLVLTPHLYLIRLGKLLHVCVVCLHLSDHGEVVDVSTGLADVALKAPADVQVVGGVGRLQQDLVHNVGVRAVVGDVQAEAEGGNWMGYSLTV